jgi:rRNA-processing protein FCF1
MEKLIKFSLREHLDKLPVVDYSQVQSAHRPIICDTNFLFTTFEFRLDVIAELKRLVGSTFTLYIFEGTCHELLSIENQKTKNKRFLPLIAKMLELYKFSIISSEQSYVDKDILELVQSPVLVATNDKPLRQYLIKKGVKVLFLRQKNHLEISSESF